MKKKILILLLPLLLLILGGIYIYREQTKPIHYHAGFQIYVDGELQDFSDWKYMHTLPCNADGKATAGELQIDKAHLHDRIGDVVHVHTGGALWKDLFINIQFPIDAKKITGAYIDGKPFNDILTQPIKEYESVLIILGDDSKKADYLKKTVTVDHIKKSESRSENCGS